MKQTKLFLQLPNKHPKNITQVIENTNSKKNTKIAIFIRIKQYERWISCTSFSCLIKYSCFFSRSSSLLFSWLSYLYILNSSEFFCSDPYAIFLYFYPPSFNPESFDLLIIESNLSNILELFLNSSLKLDF